jgi:hypothetical protein
MNSDQHTPGSKDRHDNSRLKIAGMISAIALLLLAMQWPQRGERPEIAPGPLETVPAVIDYYPAQFLNSARDEAPQEHIQAF